MNYIMKGLRQLSRVGFDLAVAGSLLTVYLTGAYVNLPNPIQLIGLKAVLTSMGFLHAHIVGKIAFPAINWKNPEEDKYLKALRVALYVIFIYAYSHGG